MISTVSPEPVSSASSVPASSPSLSFCVSAVSLEASSVPPQPPRTVMPASTPVKANTIFFFMILSFLCLVNFLVTPNKCGHHFRKLNIASSPTCVNVISVFSSLSTNSIFYFLYTGH